MEKGINLLKTTEKSKNRNLDLSRQESERQEQHRQFMRDTFDSQKWYMKMIEKEPKERTREEWTIIKLMEDNYTMTVHKLYLLTQSGKDYKIKENGKRKVQKKEQKKSQKEENTNP